MAVDFKAVGHYFEQLRTDKHLSRQQLANNLGWSEKTLQRIELGQVDMKLSQFVAYLDYLTASAATAVALTAPPTAAPEYVDDKLVAAQAADDDATLAALENALRAVTGRGVMPWVHHELAALALARAELAGNLRQATAVARRLFKAYLQYDQLTPFDYRIVARLIRYQPYAELRGLYPAAALRQNHFRWLAAGSLAAPVQDAIYRGLFESALASGEVAAVQEACTMIQARPVAAENLHFQVVQREATAMLAALAGDVAGGERQLAGVMQALTMLLPEAAAKRLTAGMRRRWQQVLSLQ